MVCFEWKLMEKWEHMVFPMFFSIAIGFKLYNYGYLNEEKEVLSLTALPKTLDLQHFFKEDV
jgi:hypothetical protein